MTSAGRIGEGAGGGGPPPAPSAASGPGGSAGSSRTSRRYEVLARELRCDAGRLQREINEIVGPEPRDLADYRRAFARDLRTAEPVRSLRRDACCREAAGFDVVYCADDHATVGAQNVCRELLDAMCRRSSTPVVVVLELVHTEHQKHLDAYLRGDIDLDRLRRRIEYDDRWGFPFAGYAALLERARAVGAKLVAANTEGSLEERDVAAGGVVAAAAAAHPGAQVLVLFGQYHLGAGHLPAATQTALAERGLARTACRVLTGDHDSYFRLLARGQHPQAVDLGGDTFCIYAAKPRRSRKSYLRYLEGL